MLNIVRTKRKKSPKKIFKKKIKNLKRAEYRVLCFFPAFTRYGKQNCSIGDTFFTYNGMARDQKKGLQVLEYARFDTAK